MTSDLEAAPLALVTGASSGIGLSLAHQLVEHEYDVVVAADEDAIHVAAADLSTGGRNVVPVQADLSTSDGVEELHRVVTSQGRPLAVAALNAGIGVNGRFVDTPLEDHLRLVDLNCRSVVHLAHLVAKDLAARGEGRLLLTASVVAKAPGPYLSTYTASKAFVHWFAESIRVELKGSGVTVTSLMPGATETEFFERADMEDTILGRMRKDDPDDVAREAYDALMAGKDHVITGSLLNRLQAAVGNLSPDKLTAAAQAPLVKPRSDS